jgi:hypothetical protein
VISKEQPISGGLFDLIFLFGKSSLIFQLLFDGLKQCENFIFGLAVALIFWGLLFHRELLMLNLISGVVAYCLKKQKPHIKLSEF